jgi:hypothetical protein
MLSFRFDEKRYAAIVKYKTSLYTFYGPIALAMIRVSKLLLYRHMHVLCIAYCIQFIP